MSAWVFLLLGGMDSIVFGPIRWCVWSFRLSSPLRLPHLKFLFVCLLFTRCKNSQTGNWSVCSSPPCTAAIFREKTMHACRTCKTCRQAAKRALPDLLSRAGAAWQHAGHARMQRCSILHTYSLDAKTHKLETGLFAPAHLVQPLSLENKRARNCMYKLLYPDVQVT